MSKCKYLYLYIHWINIIKSRSVLWLYWGDYVHFMYIIFIHFFFFYSVISIYWLSNFFFFHYKILFKIEVSIVFFFCFFFFCIFCFIVFRWMLTWSRGAGPGARAPRGGVWRWCSWQQVFWPGFALPPPTCAGPVSVFWHRHQVVCGISYAHCGSSLCWTPWKKKKNHQAHTQTHRDKHAHT